MDRNTVIGFVLIGLLLMGMFYFNNRGNAAFQAEQQRITDFALNNGYFYFEKAYVDFYVDTIKKNHSVILTHYVEA